MNSEQQLDLIFRDPSQRKHRGNPQSVAAHKRVAHTKADTWKQITELIAARKEYGATSKEVAGALGKPLHFLSGRLSELKQMGWIKENGQRRDNAAVLVIK
jgi:hypothetical protein